MARLEGKTALVTGASGHAGRAISSALAREGAMVYLTGRHLENTPQSEDKRRCLQYTLDVITGEGGTGVPIQVDHTDDAQVRALFQRIKSESGHLDILINNAWGGYETSDGFHEHVPFWELPLKQWDLMMDAGLRSHMITAYHAIPLFRPESGGLIVNTTSGIHPFDEENGHAFYYTAKVAIGRLSYHMGGDCRSLGIAALALSLGDRVNYMRSWDVAYPVDADEPTFSTTYVERCIVALACDANALRHVGTQPYLDVPALARDYGFTDIDGRQP